MKYLYLVLSLLFALFAYWQFNDPDSTSWVLVYGIVSFFHLLAFRGMLVKWSVAMATAACLVWMLTMLPGFMDWINSGMPSITSEMKTEEPHIEIVREFLGLAICTIALGHLTFRAFKQGKA